MARPTQVLIALLALVACASGTSDQAPLSSEAAPLIEFRLVHGAPAAGLESVEYDGESLYLEPRAVISDPDLQAVRPSMRQDQLLLDIHLTPEGARRLYTVTGENIGKRIALLIESQVRSAPVIRSALGSRAQAAVHRFTAAVQVTREEAERIAQLIRARWPEREGEAE